MPTGEKKVTGKIKSKPEESEEARKEKESVQGRLYWGFFNGGFRSLFIYAFQQQNYLKKI